MSLLQIESSQKKNEYLNFYIFFYLSYYFGIVVYNHPIYIHKSNYLHLIEIGHSLLVKANIYNTICQNSLRYTCYGTI